MDDDMEYESDVEEPICEGSEDDLGLEFSDEEERLVYCVIYKFIAINIYTKLKTNKYKHIINIKASPFQRAKCRHK